MGFEHLSQSRCDIIVHLAFSFHALNLGLDTVNKLKKFPILCSFLLADTHVRVKVG